MSSRARTRLSGLALAGTLLACHAGRALAHEVLHEVRRGEAVAVRVYESDGDPVAQARFEVYSPVDVSKPWVIGQTDRSGWLAFVPQGPGRWRVRVIPADGHGLDVQVEVAPPAPAAAAMPASSSPLPSQQTPPEGRAGSPLGPLLGVGLIAVVFAALVLARRRQERRPPPGPGP
jgi:nickel transport protein